MGREEGRGLETGEYQHSRFCQRKKRWRKCGERDRKEQCPVRKTEKSSKRARGYLCYVPSSEWLNCELKIPLTLPVCSKQALHP